MIDYIERGLRRNRRQPLPVKGNIRHDDGGLFAGFSLRLEHETIADVVFEASVCSTLIAYCEALAERIAGCTLAEAAHRIEPVQLVEELPGVPPDKRDRALLASQALMAAIVAAAHEAHA